MLRHIHDLLFATLLLICPIVGAAQLEMNVDRPGGDYNSFDLPAPNPQMCAARCEQDGRCRAFTYVGPGVQGANARCWFKHQVANPVGGRPGLISGVVRQTGSSLNPNFQADMDRPGGDYSNFDLPEANPELCSARCAQDGRCRAFTYVTPGIQGASARCWLKDQTANPVPARGGIITGIARVGNTTFPPPGQPKVPPFQPPVAQPPQSLPPQAQPPQGQPPQVQPPQPQPPQPPQAQPPLAQPPQVQPPIAGNPSGVWTLKEIRVRNTMNGSVATVINQKYDANGGDVEVNLSGNILDFCPGGFERIAFTWRFDRAMTQITNGSGVSAHLGARQSAKSSNCGVQLAMRSGGYLAPSAGVTYQLTAQERPLLDGERLQPGNRKRVEASGLYEDQRPGTATLKVNTHTPDLKYPYAYFFVSLDTPTAPGGGQLAFIYIYELSRN